MTSYFLLQLHCIYIESVKIIVAEYTKPIWKRFKNCKNANLFVNRLKTSIDKISHLIFQQLEDSQLLQKAAPQLREPILKMNWISFSSSSLINDSIPETRTEFCSTLVSDTNYKRHKSNACQWINKSTGEETIYNDINFFLHFSIQ